MLLNGAALAGVIGVCTQSNNHYAADCFSVDVAIGSDPGFSADFWSSADDIVLDVGFSMDGGATRGGIVQGAVDLVDIDLTGRTVRLEGRDLSASLIEARIEETFSNRTASEIADLLAARHGLTAETTATSTLVGRYYSGEHDSLTLGQFSRCSTEWDLLVRLAREEGFDVYVRGSTLHFNPPLSDTGGARVVTPAELISLRAERSLALSPAVEVTIKSWNTRQQRAFTQTATSDAGAGSAAGGPPPRVFVYVAPNLTTEQALRLAQQRLAEILRHQRVVSLSMPGDLSLSPATTLSLQGTASAFDGFYDVESVDRELSLHGGFVQHVRATVAAA